MVAASTCTGKRMGDIIERLSAKSYGCLRDVTVALTPLHAFIGPNDSGKSTLLRALRTAVQLAGDRFILDERGSPAPIQASSPAAASEGLIDAWRDVNYRVRPAGSVTDDKDPSDRFAGLDVDEEFWWKRALSRRRRARTTLGTDAHENGSFDPPARTAPPERLQFFMRGARMLRLDPDTLRAPSKLLTGGTRADFENEHGRGLPGIYDVILNQHMDGYVAIQDNLRRLFPSVRALGLENMSESTKELRIQLTSGEWIPARFMSEGMLYYLAFEAIRFLAPKAVLLVEEPENGLHPARIVEVMAVLREISKSTQVVLATHNPLVINEMLPDEVSVVTRNPQEGTKITPMKETANFEKRSTVYALGELWLSFADGVEEAPLLRGRQPS